MWIVAGIVSIVCFSMMGESAAVAKQAATRQQGVGRIADSGGSRFASHDGDRVVASVGERTVRAASGLSVGGLEHVDLFGDSLGYQAEPYFDLLLGETHDYIVSNYTYGGTATCDWLNRMAVAAGERPQAAVLVFSGNAFSPCMDGESAESAQYYQLYAKYTKQAIGIFSAVGAHVFLVGTPVDESSVNGWDHLDEIYRQLAQANPLTVTYVDAGTSVETAAGGFAWALPCMSIEPRCGEDGTNVVRAPDGVHFCPDGSPSTRGVTEPCGEYASGAFRFALAMVKAVTSYAYSTPSDR
jgi:hypothetical protein